MDISRFDIANELIKILQREYPGEYQKKSDAESVFVYGYGKRGIAEGFIGVDIRNANEIICCLYYEIANHNYYEAKDIVDRYNSSYSKSYPYAWLSISNDKNGAYVYILLKANETCYTAFGYADSARKTIDRLFFNSDLESTRNKLKKLEY